MLAIFIMFKYKLNKDGRFISPIAQSSSVLNHKDTLEPKILRSIVTFSYISYVIKNYLQAFMFANFLKKNRENPTY